MMRALTITTKVGQRGLGDEGEDYNNENDEDDKSPTAAADEDDDVLINYEDDEGWSTRTPTK